MNANFCAPSKQTYANYDNYVTRCHSKLQKERWSVYKDFICRQLKRTRTTSLFIADYGSCDGGDTLQLFHAIIEFLKSINFTGELCLLYNDLPENDFNAVYKRVISLKSCGIRVHVLMNACNMYERCSQEYSVDLGFSTYATVFLSKPVVVQNGFGWYTASETERKQIKKQAEKDWASFLTNRYQEMKAGGLLIIRFLNPGETLFRTMELSFLDISSQGLLSKEEIQNINVPIYIRTEKEIRKPIEDRSLGLGLVDIHYSSMPLFLNTEEAVASCEPWINNLLKNGLSPERDSSSKERIFKQVVSRFKEQCDLTYSNVLNTIEVVIQKISDENTNNITFH